MKPLMESILICCRLTGGTGLAFLVVLAGCASSATENFAETDHAVTTKPETSPPERFLSSAKDDTASELKDKDLTLEECVKIAQEQNPGLAAARWELEAATHDVDIARSAALPDVRATADYTDYINEQPLIAIGGDPRMSRFTDDIASASLVLNMPIYTGGRIANRIKAAELLRKASSNSLARTRRELIFNVTSVFYSILAQRHVIESVEFSRRALEEHLEQAKNLIANQKATKADRLRTEVRLADVREELARQRNVLQVKLHTLRKLLGFDKVTSDLSLNGKLEFDAKALPEAAAAVALAYDARRDLAATRKKVKARRRNVAVARAEHWPNVTFQAAYGPRWDVSNMSTAEDAGRVGVGLSLPLFEGGRIQANVLRQKSELEVARQRLRQIEHQVRLEVQTAIENVSSARERVQASQKAIEQGKESLRIARVKYRNGKASVTDVLDAQDDLLRSQRNYYRALADHNTALAELRLAIGRDGRQ